MELFDKKVSSVSNQYWHDRSDRLYFQYVDFLVRVVGRDAQSILDVGSNSCPYLEWFSWIPNKFSIDIQAPYHSWRVHGKKIDFLEYSNNREFDLCLCLQVLEHIDDVKSFAQKLLKVAHHVIVSVAYRWPAGTDSRHVQDPVDEEKLITWFNRIPNYQIIVTEPITEKRRLICYYYRDDPTKKLGIGDLQTRLIRTPFRASRKRYGQGIISWPRHSSQTSRNDTSDNSEETIALDNSEETITSRFERQVATVPDKLALVTDEISLTYRALDLKASSIAAALASLPFQTDRPIVLFLKDEAARIAAMLGALKGNRIFIPLAPDSPQQWVTQVIEDSGTAQIIVDSSTRSVAELAATGDVTVMEVEQLARSLEPSVADRTASPDNTAYIVYTSGSTGRPKGVANSHRRLIRSSDVRNRAAGVGCSDRYTNLRSSGVSSWIRNSLSPLLCGGTLFPFDLHRHGLQKLAPWLIAQKITYVSFSSPLLRTWLALLPDDLRFPMLRFIGTTDERLYAQDVIRVSRHLEGDWRIGHSYASAECGTIAAQVFTPSRLPDSGIVAVAVGRPVDGVEVCIKDETGALVPPGEIGEIVVRSRYLAQGYWNNPDLTAKVFQTDPLDSTIRIYRTGDLGRWRSDGTLEHVGRKGRRIRLRGYNVEPFQVECELIRQPGVTDAVVLLHDGAAGQEPCLVGYVVAPANASPSAIRKGLAECLPSYMVPSHIVVLDSFPIASSGKIDRSALPLPDGQEAVAFRAPSDDCERELCAIWQEILKLPKIGINDDFFELGGDSLQALMMFAEIEARLGCSVSPTTIVQTPTIACLAELIRANTSIAASQSLVLLPASGTGLPLFLVYDRAGFVTFYRHLVSGLKSDRPVYGLQPLPLDGKHRIARTIESMAADCVTEIRRVQPHGPYFIAGHSFGGKVSFEIAQQLVREGERVSFLGLIDTLFRNMAVEGWSWVSEAAYLSGKVRDVRGFQDLLFRGLRFIMWRLFRGTNFINLIRNELWFWQYDRWIRQGHSIPHKYRPAYYERLGVRANRSYVPKPYPGHITIFSSAGNSERQRAHWAPLARGGLTVLEVSARHNDMVLPPYSKLLAEHFDACLDATVRGE
jgi:amino acid adenylation domain-containing protein